MVFDPIADMITSIRNGQKSNKKIVIVPKSKFKLTILDYLKKHNYIEDFEVEERKIQIKLGYQQNQPVIKEIERISHVGGRIYVKSNNIKARMRKVGAYLLTTPGGIMESREARKKGIGGEIILRVWK